MALIAPKRRRSRGARSAGARVLLRLPAWLHRALKRTAQELGLSLNEYLLRRLSPPATWLAGTEDAGAVLERAHELFGRRLVGVVVYGSWARGQVEDRSDVDVLVVVDPGTPLTRDLYRQWDRRPLRWQGRPVDVHVVRLPTDADGVTSLWCETAIEGLVLYERDGRLSAWLARVRREIAAGRWVRHVVHGQPYWTMAA